MRLTKVFVIMHVCLTFSMSHALVGSVSKLKLITCKIRKVCCQSTTNIQSDKFLSTVSLISGTTVGAGILALPAFASKAGFIPSSLTLFGSWVVMTFSGILIAEVIINYQKKKSVDNSSLGILFIAKETCGETIGYLSGIVYAFLHYALLVAYIVEGGKVITEIFSVSDTWIGPLLFTTFLGVILAFGSELFIENFNNLFTLLVLVSFISLLSIGVPSVTLSNLQYQDVSKIWQIIPIMYLSLVYHNVVPTVCEKLSYNPTRIREAIVIGTLIPCIMFLLWDLVIIGIGSGGGGEAGALQADFDPVELLRRGGQAASGVESAYLSSLLSVFSEAAVITSFVGFVYGLKTFFADILRDSNGLKDQNLAILALIILPPLAIAELEPGIFFQAVDTAGTYGVTLLFVLLPVLMSWVTRYGARNGQSVAAVDNDSTVVLLPGGQPLLSLIAGCSGLVIAEKLFS